MREVDGHPGIKYVAQAIKVEAVLRNKLRLMAERMVPLYWAGDGRDRRSAL